MKKIYGDHMEDFHKSKTPKKAWSEKDKEDFKRMVTKRIQQSNMLEGFSNAFIYLATASIVGIAIYLAFSWK